MENAFQEAIFWVLAVVTVGGALMVVLQRDMFRAALSLIVSFLGVAGLFAQLNAEFLAVAQLLIYGGAVSVLVIFAVMLTRDVPRSNRSTPMQPVALALAALLFAGLTWAVVQAEWRVMAGSLPPSIEQAFVDTPARLGNVLLSEFVLAFEIAGVLLLAAVIGALSLVRGR